VLLWLWALQGVAAEAKAAMVTAAEE